MTDPDRLVGAQAVEQFDHVGDDVFLCIVLVPVVHAGSAIAAHVRRDGAKAQTAKHRQLMAPRNRKLRPTVDEDDRSSRLGAACKVESRVARALDHALFDRVAHGISRVDGIVFRAEG
jgi:hypothetical protein